MARKASLAAIFMALYPCVLGYCATKDIVVGGSVSVSFEDLDVDAAPGPTLGSDRSGSVADFSIGMSNDYVVAGVKLSLALTQKNIDYSTDPVTYYDLAGYTPFPLTSAYIRLKKLFGAADLQLDADGNLIGVGSMVVSNKSRQFDAIENVVDPRTGLSVEVPGILDYWTLRLLVNEDPGSAATATKAATADDWAGKAMLLFEGDALTFKLSGGAFDFQAPGESWFAGAEAQFTFGESFRTTVSGECTFLGTSEGSGGAAWGGLSFEALGVKLSGNVYGKTYLYGSDTTVLSISSAKNEFDSRKNVDCLAADGSLSYNARALLGSNVLTLNGGGGAMLTGERRWGWSAGAVVALSEAAGIPMMVGGSAWKYGDSGLGPFGNTALLWKAWTTYDYHGLALKAEIGRREYDDPATTGTKRDSGFGYTLSASVAF